MQHTVLTALLSFSGELILHKTVQTNNLSENTKISLKTIIKITITNVDKMCIRDRSKTDDDFLYYTPKHPKLKSAENKRTVPQIIMEKFSRSRKYGITVNLYLNPTPHKRH